MVHYPEGEGQLGFRVLDSEPAHRRVADGAISLPFWEERPYLELSFSQKSVWVISSYLSEEKS